MPNNYTRAAPGAPKSYDEKSHTIDMEVSTENVVHGVSLSHKRGAVDLSRFIGAPFLNAHKRGDVRDVLGKIISARIEDRKLIATVKLTRRADAAGIVQDIIDGMIPQTSVGYTISEWGQDSVDPKSGARTRTATRWRPFEVSAVPYAADETRVRSEPANPGAHVRKEKPMSKKKTGATPAPDSDVLENEPANENTVAETRAEIRDVFKRALPNDLARATAEADAIIDADGDIAEAKARALDIMEARSQSTPRVRVTNSGPSPEETLHARAGGFALRYLGVATKDERARHYAGFDSADLARECLEAIGVRTRGMSREALLTAALQTRAAGAHTTSDFPLMLDIGLSTGVRAAYEAALSPIVPLCFKDTAPDFRPQYRHQLGELPKLQKVSESGEVKAMTRGEARESWTNDTYGGIFNASRKLIINDAFNQLGDFARDAGQAAAATVADLVVSTLTQAGGVGPTMGDGNPLFDASHGNLFTPADSANIDEAGVSALRKAMLLQTGVDGVTIINVRPDTIVVAPTRLTEAEKFVAAISPASAGDVNPFSEKLSVVCEPRLEAINPFAWYLADSRHPALVLGGLAGSEGPQVSARDGWEVLGREWRVTLDVGVGPRDWRGWAMNDGQDSNTSIA